MIFSIEWDPSLGVDLGFFTLRYYSLMFLVAFVSGWYLTKAIFVNEKESLEKLDKLLIYMVIATLLGARLGHVLFYQSELFTQDPLSILLPFQFVPTFEFTGFAGLASHGATIGITIALLLYSKKIAKRHPAWIFDRIVISVSFGAIFVRLGNFLNSEIIGKPTNSDYGVVFKKLGEDFARHPSQLYEAGGYLLLFLLMYFLYWKTKASNRQGLMFGIFFTLLWTIRFFVEFSKEPQVKERADWIINTGQILSIPMILVGLVVIFLAQQNYKKHANEAA